jgi:hypothetical protein
VLPLAGRVRCATCVFQSSRVAKAREGRAMINAMPQDLATRVAELELQFARLRPRSGQERYGRDGRAVLSVRLGAETCALVRLAAKERGCTIADLLRPAILGAVNAPSTTPPPSVPQAKTPGEQMAARLADPPSASLANAISRRLPRHRRTQPRPKPASQGAVYLRDT